MESQAKLKIYVLNLKRSIERREYMMDQLKKFHINYEIFDAVDGRLLSDNYIKEHGVIEKLNEIDISKGHFACALSHMFIYKKIIERNDDHILILEDDIELGENFFKLVFQARRYLENGEIIFPYFIPKPNCKVKRTNEIVLTKGHSIRYVLDPERVLATGSYLLTKKTATSLFHGAYPVRTQPDDWGYFKKQGLIEKTRMIYPMVARSANFASDIGYLDKYKLLNKIVRYLQQKTPILDPVFKIRRKKIAQRLRDQIKIVDQKE